MQKITLEQFNALLKEAPIKPRLKRELRFVASTSDLTEEDWVDSELIAISDKSGNKGVLIVASQDELYLLPYAIKRGLTSSLTGRAQPIICDFCRTWQTGSRAGSITIQTQKNVSYLCCTDLQCSRHVRTKTSAAHTSRSQLREDMTTQQRVERLNERLAKILTDVQAESVQAHGS